MLKYGKVTWRIISLPLNASNQRLHTFFSIHNFFLDNESHGDIPKVELSRVVLIPCFGRGGELKILVNISSAYLPELNNNNLLICLRS